MALSVTRRGYVMAGGAVVASGLVDELKEDERIMQAYLGMPSVAGASIKPGTGE